MSHGPKAQERPLPDLSDFCRLHALAWFDTEHISSVLANPDEPCSCPRCGHIGAEMNAVSYYAICETCGYGKPKVSA